jgi:hypothetical protein
MSVNIFSERLTSDCNPRLKNGQPAHTTTAVCMRNHVRHSQTKDRKCERGANPEPPGHVTQLGVVLFAASDHVLRFQRHSANRAVAWLILLDPRMHRAGINGFCALFMRVFSYTLRSWRWSAARQAMRALIYGLSFSSFAGCLSVHT